MEIGDVVVKNICINLSFETDDNGNITSINNDTNHPLTRRVLIEKYVLKTVEIDLFGGTTTAIQSIYEEPSSFED